MLSRWHLLAGLLFLFIRSSYSLYTNDLVLELDHDDIKKAQDLAQKHGLRFKKSFFIVTPEALSARAPRSIWPCKNTNIFFLFLRMKALVSGRVSKQFPTLYLN